MAQHGGERGCVARRPEWRRAPTGRPDDDPPLPTHTHAPQALRRELPPLLDRLRPQLVLYNAGVDVHADDSLGLLALTDAGIAERDRFVLATCAACGAPVAAAIGGGYAPDHESIVSRHMLLHRAAAEALPALSASCGAAAAAERRRRASEAARAAG